MKKLLVMILILAMILPVAAWAETDPIVGSWYFLYDKSAYPEMSSLFEGYDIAFSIYWFMENGTIMSTDLSATGESGNTKYAAAGRWRKTDSGYSYSIIGSGEGTAVLDGDELFLTISGKENLYMMIRRMIPFNPYKDYVRK